MSSADKNPDTCVVVCAEAFMFIWEHPHFSLIGIELESPKIYMLKP